MLFKESLKKYATFTLLGITSFVISTISHADQDLVSTFPLKNYSQTISTWINPNDPQFNKSLLSEEMQQKRFDIFYDHYFGSSSPWSEAYVNQIFLQPSPNNLKSIEQTIISNFSNEGKSADQLGYGENFHVYEKNWIEEIASNINFSQFDRLTYQPNNRGIAIDNLHARALPTDDVHFYSYKLAGQGYPFDNLQMSALWAGTPVYIIGDTKDHVWLLVITPDYIGWVKSSGIAIVDNNFIKTWTKAAKNKLAAITHTQTSLIDNKGRFILLAYVGAVFPGETHSTTDRKLMVPAADADRNAVIKYAVVPNKNAVFIPIAATPHNFSTVMSTMINRTYGWGSMYFYNDCSAELKSFFTPFGIWLPRHSSYQVTAGKMVDMTSASAEKRLAYLMENGHRFMTIIYIGGHIILYVGNQPNPQKPDSLMAMTYQNIWGLLPNPGTRRVVIGQSVLFPMLLQYPEDPSLVSLAAKKYFQVSYLDQWPDANTLLKKGSASVDLKSLMLPEIEMK